MLTREPGGTSLGEALRELLLDPAIGAVTPEAEALLHTAARSEHVAQVILPALNADRIVICDRYVDSTLAYQGAGRGLPLDDLRRLHAFATHDLWPDLTILLDLPVDLGVERRRASGEALTRFDRESLAFHQRVRTHFLQAAQADAKRWYIIDADDDADTIARMIFDVVARRLGFDEDGNVGG